MRLGGGKFSRGRAGVAPRHFGTQPTTTVPPANVPTVEAILIDAGFRVDGHRKSGEWGAQGVFQCSEYEDDGVRVDWVLTIPERKEIAEDLFSDWLEDNGSSWATEAEARAWYEQNRAEADISVYEKALAYTWLFRLAADCLDWVGYTVEGVDDGSRYLRLCR